VARIAVADGEIDYEQRGSGHPLIFISGLSGVGRYWQAQVPVFSEHYRVVTYDQRGTGESDKHQRSFSVDQMTAEVVALMDALGIERAHIVGHSTGGAIGQTLAIEYPQRIARMVVFATWTHCDPWFRRLFEARRALYSEAGPELHARFHPLWLYPPDYVNAHDAEIDQERKNAVAGAPPVAVSVGRIDAILGFDRRAELKRITTPTLILCADNDYITPSYHAEALGRAIAGSRVVILEGGGHSVSKTRAEEFNRLVMDFLAAE